MTLLQPGTAPLTELRYHLTRGSKTASELVYDFEIKNDGQGGAMPTLVVELETTVEDVLADGAAKLRIAVVRTSVRDRPGSERASDLLRKEAVAMHGVVITEMLAPDGKVWDTHVQTAAALGDKLHAQLDSVSQSLERVAMRLPTEPVGIGAMWRERKTLPQGGIHAVAETTYTIESRTGDIVAYSGTGLSTGAPQTLEQDGAKVEITNTRGHSEAKGTLDLSRYALDVTATSTFMTTMNVVAPSGTPGAGASTVEITMAIRMSPPSATPADRAPADAVPHDAVPHDAVPHDPPAASAAPARSAATPRADAPHGAHKAP